MDKNRAAAVAAIGERGEQIKINSAEYLWICCGVRPPLVPDKPIITDRSAAVPDEQLQLQTWLLDGRARLRRR
jgi:hypothetical protein